MDGYQAALDVLPERIRSAAAALGVSERQVAMEFRLRCGYAPTVLLPTGERRLADGAVQPRELRRILELSSGASPYAVAENLRAGFITADRGVRIGFCGETVATETGIRTIRELSSAAVRIPRELRGCADGLCTRPFVSVLILSPPGIGKTTLLRDMIRQYSDSGLRVALADERGEVAALCHGEPGYDVGRCTDVLSGGRKSETAVMLLRSMGPDILAMDEITAQPDIDACEMVSHCGVGILATAHAGSIRELQERPLYRGLLSRRIFCRAILISKIGCRRIYREEKLC